MLALLQMLKPKILVPVLLLTKDAGREFRHIKMQ